MKRLFLVLSLFLSCAAAQAERQPRHEGIPRERVEALRERAGEMRERLQGHFAERRAQMLETLRQQRAPQGQKPQQRLPRAEGEQGQPQPRGKARGERGQSPRGERGDRGERGQRNERGPRPQRGERAPMQRGRQLPPQVRMLLLHRLQQHARLHRGHGEMRSGPAPRGQFQRPQAQPQKPQQLRGQIRGRRGNEV